MTGNHDKIIASAAIGALQPLGFRRKGRSRLWLKDNGWWLTVVEFQLSGFRKGSYLNVAAHWLWSQNGYISFDLGGGPVGEGRIGGFEAYETDDQFSPAAQSLAEAAADASQHLGSRLSSIAAAADILVDLVSDIPQSAVGVGKPTMLQSRRALQEGERMQKLSLDRLVIRE